MAMSIRIIAITDRHICNKTFNRLRVIKILINSLNHF
ncbi:hypothetical protein YPPY66_3137, partial [Yersinia pestis PY-66]